MFFIGNFEIIVLLDSQNRAISSLTACIFQTNGLFPSEFQSWNGIVETYHYGNVWPLVNPFHFNKFATFFTSQCLIFKSSL